MDSPREQLERLRAQGADALGRVEAAVDARAGEFFEHTGESGRCTARVDLRGRLIGVTFHQAGVMADVGRQELAAEVTAVVKAAQGKAGAAFEALSRELWNGA